MFNTVLPMNLLKNRHQFRDSFRRSVSIREYFSDHESSRGNAFTISKR